MEGIDTSVPNIARVYDCLLGGKDHFAVDRVQAAKLIEFDPSLLGLRRYGVTKSLCAARREIRSTS